MKPILSLLLFALAMQAANDTVTIQLRDGGSNTTTNNIRYCWGEYSGISTSPVDKVAHQSVGTSQTSLSSTATATTAQATELAVGSFFGGVTETYTAGGSYTMVDAAGTAGQRLIQEYLALSSAATQTATATQNTGGGYVGHIVTFKASSTPAVVSANHGCNCVGAASCGAGTSNVASITITLTSPAANALDVVSIRTGTTGITGVSISDTNGSTWASADATYFGANGVNDANAAGYIQVFYALNAGSATAKVRHRVATNSVHTAFEGALDFFRKWVEFSELAMLAR